MAKGYKQRWFVLENGQLSYYRDQEDEGKASRGGLSMNSARVVGPSDDKLKFEVSQLTSKYGKLYLRANRAFRCFRTPPMPQIRGSSALGRGHPAQHRDDGWRRFENRLVDSLAAERGTRKMRFGLPAAQPASRRHSLARPGPSWYSRCSHVALQPSASSVQGF